MKKVFIHSVMLLLIGILKKKDPETGNITEEELYNKEFSVTFSNPKTSEVISVPDTGLFKDHFIELFGLLIKISGIGIFYKVKKENN